MASNEIVVSPSSPNTISVNETTNEITVTKGVASSITITAGGPKGDKGDTGDTGATGLGVNIITETSIGLGANSLSTGVPLNTVGVGVDTHTVNETSSNNSGKILNNTVIGLEASKIHKGKNNTVIGVRALDTADNTNKETENNIVIGYEAGRNLDNSNKHNILIGDNAKVLKKTETTQGHDNININTDQDGNNQILFDGQDLKLLRFSGFADGLKTNAVEFDSESRLVVPASIKEYVFNFKNYLEAVMISMFEANKESNSIVEPANYTFDFPTNDRNEWNFSNNTYTKKTVTVAKADSPVAFQSRNDLNNESFYDNSTNTTKKLMVTDDLFDKLADNTISDFPTIERAFIRLQAINGSLQTLDLKDTNFQNIYESISALPSGVTSIDYYSLLSDQRVNDNYTFTTIDFQVEMEEGESIGLTLCNPYKPTTLNWASSIKWVGGVVPDLATGETSFHNIEFWKQSGTIYAAHTGMFS